MRLEIFIEDEFAHVCHGIKETEEFGIPVFLRFGNLPQTMN